MNIINVNKKINEIETEHVQLISKLTLLGLNIWQLYRIRFWDRNVSGLSSQKQRTREQGSYTSAIRFARLNRGTPVLRVSSASYGESVDGVFYSRRLAQLRKDIKVSKGQVCLVGVSSVEKADRLSPGIDFELDTIVSRVGSSLARLLAIFHIFSAVRHYLLLRKISDWRFLSVLRDQSRFTAKFLLFFGFYSFMRPSLVLFLMSSYGNEAEIAALKILKIATYEYQHGTIEKYHHGYTFSGALHLTKGKMPIPDKIFVYGDIWKSNLTHRNFFDPDDIVVSGHPDLYNIPDIDLPVTDKTIILVISNPALKDSLQRFIKNYQKNSLFGNDYLWVVKLHPREVIDGWGKFLDHNENVTISYADTFSLLNKVSFQLNAVSSTSHEGRGLGVTSYTIATIIDPRADKSSESDITNYIDENWIGKFEENINKDMRLYYSRYSPYFLNKVSKTKKEKLLIREVNDNAKDIWDEMVAQSEQFSIFSTNIWLHCYDQNSFQRVGIFLDQQLIGGIILPKTGAPLLMQKIAGPLLVYPATIMKNARRYEFQKRVLAPLAEYIKNNSKSYTALAHYSFDNWLPFKWHGFKQTTRYSFRVDLNLSEDELWQGLDTKIRGDIRKAENQGIRVRSGTLEEFLKLFLQEKVTKRKGQVAEFYRDNYDRLHEEGVMQIIVCYKENTVISAGLFVFDQKNIFYLDAARLDDFPKSGAQAYLIWNVIKNAAGEQKHFDFLGSSIPAVEKFFRGFGGQLTPASYIMFRKVFWHLRSIKG